MQERERVIQSFRGEMSECDAIVEGLLKEKQRLEISVQDVTLRLEAATKHTQALADERTFLQVSNFPFATAMAHCLRTCSLVPTQRGWMCAWISLVDCHAFGPIHSVRVSTVRWSGV